MDTSQIGTQDVAAAAKRRWRRHSPEFKARVIDLARQPGASVAAVALANGLNANMLRRWVHEAAAGSGALKAAATGVAPYPSGQVTVTADTKRMPPFRKQATSDAAATPGSGWPDALAAVRAHP